jgi:enoyl-CoA hydratase/carnithine racemase
VTLPAYATLRTGIEDETVLVVTLHRPQAANAFNTEMGREMLDLWTRLGTDPGGVRCVVLTGAGERAFCAGADLKERHGMSDADWQRQHELFERAVWTMIDCPLPVLAAVNGAAYAGGLELVLAADFAYGARHARFAFTEVTIGIMPGVGGTQNLPRAVGERRAKEIVLAGRPFGAEEAAAWGLLNRVLEPAELMPAALATARAIAANAPLAVRQAKKAIHFGMQTDLATALRFEVEAYNRLIPTEDRREGIAAFNEKRKPVFRGR